MRKKVCLKIYLKRRKRRIGISYSFIRYSWTRYPFIRELVIRELVFFVFCGAKYVHELTSNK